MRRSGLGVFLGGLLGLSLLVLPARAASEADKVVSRYHKAAGGKQLGRLKSAWLRGIAHGPGGEQGTFSLRLLAPDQYRVDFEAGALRFTESYNGKSGWRQDAGGLGSVLGADLKSLRLEAMLAAGRYHGLSRQKILRRPPVAEAVDGKPARRVDFVWDEARVGVAFDEAGAMPVRWESSRGGQPFEWSFGDYRAEADGVAEPRKLRLVLAGQEWTAEVTEALHDREVSARDFDQPASADGRPLPDVAGLLERLLKNQESLEALREQYAFDVTEVERRQEKDGEYRVVSTKIFQVTPIAGGFVERLVSVDGRELSPDKQAKEDRRVDRKIEELKKGRVLKEERKNELSISDILRLCEITSIRREKLRDQEVLAFDFQPRGGVLTRTRVEKLAASLAGTVRIDEAALQVARLDARLVRPFKIGGGLVATLGTASGFVFEQEKVRGEIWLPSYAEGLASGRYLLVGRLNVNVVRQYGNYQKYEVESTVEPAP